MSVWPHPHPEGGVVVLQNNVYKNVDYHFILTYKVSVSQLARYVHKFAPIIMYGLGLFIVVLTRTTI